ncbi:MAG: threonine/serine dehydratase [Rhizobiales bacterium]|nr:threonine/serine dehydratase [Hyphomicrobiales bacterium]NRB14008.1 threonine/serine dehydratase [Hyphomicrobiales bacterium]
MIDKSTIIAAYKLIKPYIRQTPVIDVSAADILGDRNQNNRINFKLEQLQYAGCFKPRGAFYSLLSQPQLPTSVAAASGGNHGAAVAYAAHILGIDAHIFVPKGSPQAKINRIKDFGANVMVDGDNYAAALDNCNQYIQQSAAFSIHAYDDISTITGQATTALEWHAQVKDLDTILIAVGGGGLIAGMAAYLKQVSDVKIVCVEPTHSASMYEAMANNQVVKITPNSIAADSLGSSSAGKNCFAIAQQDVDEFICIDDEDILKAQHILWNDYRILAELGGATAFAALSSKVYETQPDEKIGVLICGGNCSALGE